MGISLENYNKLCELAKTLNELGMNEEWRILNDIINEIEGE